MKSGSVVTVETGFSKNLESYGIRTNVKNSKEYIRLMEYYIETYLSDDMKKKIFNHGYHLPNEDVIDIVINGFIPYYDKSKTTKLYDWRKMAPSDVFKSSRSEDLKTFLNRNLTNQIYEYDYAFKKSQTKKHVEMFYNSELWTIKSGRGICEVVERERKRKYHETRDKVFEKIPGNSPGGPPLGTKLKMRSIERIVDDDNTEVKTLKRKRDDDEKKRKKRKLTLIDANTLVFGKDYCFEIITRMKKYDSKKTERVLDFFGERIFTLKKDSEFYQKRYRSEIKKTMMSKKALLVRMVSEYIEKGSSSSKKSYVYVYASALLVMYNDMIEVKLLVSKLDNYKGTGRILLKWIMNNTNRIVFLHSVPTASVKRFYTNCGFFDIESKENQLMIRMKGLIPLTKKLSERKRYTGNDDDGVNTTCPIFIYIHSE